MPVNLGMEQVNSAWAKIRCVILIAAAYHYNLAKIR
jgi:hypothetical protein